jgi:hypothetical protein|tara:strand:- start:896 stop:1195 length:300 start_codon:yes stop_codon:yes gene_type:complete
MSKLKSKEALSDKDPKLSKKELAERREEITAFYKDNIPHLEVQADYEMLLAQIEKSRAERMQAQMFMAQQYSEQKGGVDPNSEDGKAFQEAMAKAVNPE